MRTKLSRRFSLTAHRKSGGEPLAADILDLAARGKDVELIRMAVDRNGNLPALRLLLDSGADPNHTGYDGQTCLQLAAAAGHSDVVEILRAHASISSR
jgi:ankyrin repeat protein